jgi:hypothetical protein
MSIEHTYTHHYVSWPQRAQLRFDRRTHVLFVVLARFTVQNLVREQQ